MREEFLKKAIHGEIEAMNFYREVAGQVRNKKTKDELLKLSREEKKHKEILEKRYREIFKKEFEPLEGFVFNPDLDANKYHIDSQAVALQVVSVAIQAEEDAISLYSEELKNVKDKEDRDLLLNLIKFEESHKEKLKEEYQKLKKSYHWGRVEF